MILYVFVITNIFRSDSQHSRKLKINTNLTFDPVKDSPGGPTLLKSKPLNVKGPPRKKLSQTVEPYSLISTKWPILKLPCTTLNKDNNNLSNY